jgi:hypothetical protein
MKILLGGFSDNIGKEDISKPAVGNVSLHDISTGNGVKSSNLMQLKSIDSSYRHPYGLVSMPSTV